ncbi:hypothetical protein [Occallatibacter riparius]|uniref:Uncharacterized protein n=1 Tax=Occallatibacter riparius TaxID=1002689 RepID=A0A9J7BXR8_9BACT|nr:hypothetical protein [Occallatibacter riparius]UWZ86029.1 hypothetical protein MOP44_08800 [Occallatibacter riparius]
MRSGFAFFPSLRLLALAASLIISVTNVAKGQDHVDNPDEVCSGANLKSSALVEDYDFRSYLTENDGACFQVLKRGKIVFRRTVWSNTAYMIGQPGSTSDQVPAIRNGADLTGRGHPNMIVSEWSGGAHCCLSHYVFELEPKFRLLAKLEARDTWPAYFADLDRDGRYYYIAEDWAFAYWLGSFGGSPNHEVILRWIDDDRGGGYHLALDKMQQPAPSPTEWREAIDKIRSDLATEKTGYVSSLPLDMWQEVMDLIYTGHPDLAWKFLDEAGPEAQRGKRDFDLESFCITLKESLYWPDLARTLKDAPAKCLNARATPPKK